MNRYEEDTGTEFDMSFSTLNRINYNLWQANQAQFDNNAPKWFEFCRILYKEIDTYLSDKKLKDDEESPKDKHKKMYEDCLKSYRVYLIYENNYSKFKGRSLYAPPKKIFDLLFNWELELRKDMDKFGLLMKKAESAKGAIL